MSIAATAPDFKRLSSDPNHWAYAFRATAIPIPDVTAPVTDTADIDPALDDSPTDADRAWHAARTADWEPLAEDCVAVFLGDASWVDEGQERGPTAEDYREMGAVLDGLDDEDWDRLADLGIWPRELPPGVHEADAAEVGCVGPRMFFD